MLKNESEHFGRLCFFMIFFIYDSNSSGKKSYFLVRQGYVGYLKTGFCLTLIANTYCKSEFTAGTTVKSHIVHFLSPGRTTLK